MYQNIVTKAHKPKVIKSDILKQAFSNLLSQY